MHRPNFRIQHIDHIVLRTNDAERLLAFYRDVLGCTLELRNDRIGLLQLRAGASLIDLVPVDGELGRAGGAAPAAQGRNLDHFCLRLEPFDEAALRAHLAAHGVQAGPAAQRNGAEGIGPSIYIQDPEGNVVELKGPPSAPEPRPCTKEIVMQASPHPFSGLRVAVTGGTSGLGLALAQALHRQGAQLAFIARDAARVAAVARTLPGSHGIVGDVARKLDTHALALQVTAALGGLDLLVHNASSLGPVPLAPLADTDCEDLEAALATNLLGPFRLSKALLGALSATARAGRPALVLHIGSDAAVTPYAGWGAYGASKAALLHLARIWDEELRAHGVRMLSIDPGDMDTPLHALALPDADPATLKPPAVAAAEVLAFLQRHLGNPGLTEATA